MFSENNYIEKMRKTIDVFTKELSSLRTGRANANMLDIIKELDLKDLKIIDFYRIKIGD